MEKMMNVFNPRKDLKIFVASLFILIPRFYKREMDDK